MVQLCAQMANNMGGWTASSAYHQETVTHTYTHVQIPKSVNHLGGS